MNILRDYTPDVEQYSIDEAFMDMSGTEKLFGPPVEVANEIRERIYRELGFTVNVGVSDVKLLAKMASDFKKPNLVHTLFLSEIKEKMWPLPVSELFFVGRATAAKLFSLGIKSIEQLANTDPAILKLHMKSQGAVVWAFANGVDMSPVQTHVPKNKGYGNSTTISFDVVKADDAKRVLLALCETVGQRLRKDDVKIEVVAVGIKSYNLQYSSHQMTLLNATNITNDIYRYACKVFDELWDGVPIRHLGVHTGRVKEAAQCMWQLDLFSDMEYQKWEEVDKTVDAVREKYGIDSIKRASFLQGAIDHMSGGISREKRTVDYSKLKIE